MLKFISIKNSKDGEYNPILDNFLYYLDKAQLKEAHEIIEVDSFSGEWATDNFLNIVYKKLEVTHTELVKGNTVFFVDLDIVFLRDPIEHMLSLLKDSDIVIQEDTYGQERPCTGFFMVRPTPLTIDLFNSAEKFYIKGEQGDQGYIFRKLQTFKERYEKLKLIKLDRNLFPCGKYWYKHYDAIKDPYIIHYNHTHNVREKVEKMKEFGHFFHEAV